MGRLLARREQNLFIAEVVEFADCGVAAEVVGEEGCGVWVEGGQLGECLLGGGDEGVER